MKKKLMRLSGWLGARTGDVAYYAVQVTMAVVYFVALGLTIAIIIAAAILLALFEIVKAIAVGFGKVMTRCRKWTASKRLKPAVDPS